MKKCAKSRHVPAPLSDDHEYRFEGHPVLPLAEHAEAELPIIYGETVDR